MTLSLNGAFSQNRCLLDSGDQIAQLMLYFTVMFSSNQQVTNIST